MNRAFFLRRIAKPAVFLICLIPLTIIVWQITSGEPGPNPVETVNRYLGDWALRLLLVALAVSPLAHITGWSAIIRFRRMLGLFAFGYALLHVTNYVVADQFFDWPAIWADIVKRRYITVGAATLLILLSLALTSTKGMIRRLGGKRWRKLHRAVYVAGVGGVFHYWMMVKADLSLPILHAVILFALLAYRIIRFYWNAPSSD